MESFFNSLKKERIFHERYSTRDAARLDLFDYIKGFYNGRCRHSSIGYRTPIQQYEAWFEKGKLAA